MASKEASDKARFVGGPRAIGALLPAVTRPAFRARSPPRRSSWRTGPSIGPALRRTHPRRFSGGTLTLACSGPIALELQHLTGELAERINAHFGRTLVERFRFVQSAPEASQAAPAPPASSAGAVEVPGMPPGALRDALAALGGAVVQTPRRRPRSTPSRGRSSDPA